MHLKESTGGPWLPAQFAEHPLHVAEGEIDEAVREEVGMTAGGAMILITVLVFSGMALLAFGWAAVNRQFSDPEANARSIFDADEPVGQSTDAFPGKHKDPDDR